MSVIDGLLLLWLFRLLYLVCAAMAVAIIAATCPRITPITIAMTLVVGFMLASTLILVTLMAVIVILSIKVVAVAVILLVALILLIAILLVTI